MNLIRNYEISSDIKIEQLSDINKNKSLNFDYTFKILLIGDSGVGKSSLLIKGVKNIFLDQFISTIGYEFFYLGYKINNKFIKLQLWDTCGQERYRSLIRSLYKNSSLTIMVYAINDNSSFNNLEFWLKEIKLNSQPNIPIFLIGNKNDIENERFVQTKNAKSFFYDYNLQFFMETSAKIGSSSNLLFQEVAKYLYFQIANNVKEKNIKPKKELKLQKKKDEKLRIGTCC